MIRQHINITRFPLWEEVVSFGWHGVPVKDIIDKLHELEKQEKEDEILLSAIVQAAADAAEKELKKLSEDKKEKKEEKKEEKVVAEDANHIKTLDHPEGWRVGQTLFNFLEYCRTHGHAENTQSSRMADPFHISNEDLEVLWSAFMAEHKK